MLLRAALLSLPLLVSASSSPHKHASGITTDPSTANGQTFDYIVVGAGLTGMTVAARLSEDPSKSILLVEAGLDERLNPGIYNLSLYASLFGTAVDWAWATDQGKALQGGKMLGGSSSFTACHWLRGMKTGYDAISSLVDGEEDWSFDALFPYMKKAEKFYIPTEQQRASGADYIYDYHGYSGPVQVTFPDELYSGSQEPTFVNVIRNITGIGHCKDMEGGFSNCVGYMPRSFDPSANYTKSTSATAYLSPVLARQEVILAAGAIGTPQLLQLSGVGNSAVLEPLGIEVKINLPTVGKYLQERTRNEITYSLQPSFDLGGPGPAVTMAYPSLKELFTESGGSNGTVSAEQVADYIKAMYPTWAQSQAGNALNADALTSIFKVIVELIVDSNVPAVEIFFNSDELGIEVWQMNPFSRGNVTITSTDAFVQPQIIINYFSIDFDLAVQTAGARLSRQILKNAAFQSIFTNETTPGLTAVPDDEHGGSDADWQAFIKANFLPVGHYFGTTPMMRRDLGGVVDSKLLVYDTTNLRIVDGGIISLPISAAPQATLYGTAEKAADIIKSGA